MDMADSESPDALATPNYNDFDTWRAIIAEHIEAGTVDDPDVYKTSPMRNAQKELSKDFKIWLADETYWNGVDRPQLNSAVGKNIKDALEFGNECVFQNWNGTFLSWLMDPNNVKFQKIISEANAKPELATYRRLVADIMRAVGEDLAKGKSGNEPLLKSNYYNEQLPDTVQYKARMANGQWENIDEKDLIDKLRNPKGPHVIFTANHAFLDSKASDIDSIGQAFTSLYEGALVDPNNPNSPKLSAWDDPAGLDGSKTVMVMATNTAPNRFLNLADLFRRLNEIEAYHDHPEDDTFEHVSPIAVQTVATILAASVEEGEQKNIHFLRGPTGKPQFSHVTLHIRPEAMDSLRRMMFTVFSKGGNDSRDAMRLLVHALHAKTVDGKPLVIMPKGIEIPDFIRNISMMVTGLNEEPMDQYYIDQGVLAPIYTNKPDPTAPIPAWRFNPMDPTYNFDGSAKVAKGHEPNQSVEGILADWRLRDQQRMAFAGTLGKAAITDINFVPNGNGGYDPNVLSLEVAPGTTDIMMDKAVEALNDDLALNGVRIVRVGTGQGRDRYQLRGEGLVTIDSIEKLSKAFQPFAATTIANQTAINAKVAKAVEEGVKARAGERAELDRKSEEYVAAQADITAQVTTQIEKEELAALHDSGVSGVTFVNGKILSAPPADAPLWVSESVTFEKLNAIKDALELEQHKGGTKNPSHYRPMDIADPAKQVRDIEIINTLGLEGEIHPRVARNLKGHARITSMAPGEQQIG